MAINSDLSKRDLWREFLAAVSDFMCHVNDIRRSFCEVLRQGRIRDLRQYQHELKANLNYELGEIELAAARECACARVQTRKLLDRAARKIERLEGRN